MRFLASVLLLLMFTCSFVYAIDDDSLVLYCPFDEGNGDTVTDMKSGLVGIINGPQWTNDGKLNSALEFVNTTDNVEFADEDVLDIIGEITMEAWVFPSEVQADSGIMGRRSAANVGGYCMQWTAGKFEMWLNVNGGGWQGTRDKQTIVPETGEWHHVACIYDGEAELQYIDGELDIKFDAAGEIASIGEVFRIGGAQTALASVVGMIDEVAVYSRALSQDEIKEDMGKGVFSPVSPAGNLSTTWGNIKR